MGVCLNGYNMEAAMPITIDQNNSNNWFTDNSKKNYNKENNYEKNLYNSNEIEKNKNKTSDNPKKNYNKENNYDQNLYNSYEIEKNKNKTFENNIIKMKIKIDNNDVNKPTKILYNINEYCYYCDLNELNESNTELYINDKKYKYKSYFSPEKEGIYNNNLI